MSQQPIPLRKRRPRRMLFWMLGILVVIGAVGAFAAYKLFFSGTSRSARWLDYWGLHNDAAAMAAFVIEPGARCDDAAFAFPTRGVIFGLWDESYRVGHRHQGLDIFPGTEPGVTPVYAAHAGYLRRLADWKSTVIIRIPEDPLQPSRQIWTYYTHMADVDGNSYISAEFPPGTTEVWVAAGTFLGYVGNYSGSAVNPTGVHLHISVVKDDGEGTFTNELDINNTYDPTPYFNLPVDYNENPDDFPVCAGTVTVDDWELVPDHE